MGVHAPMSSGSRLNSSKPNVPSGRAKMSTQRSTPGVDGLANTVQDGSRREDMPDTVRPLLDLPPWGGSMLLGVDDLIPIGEFSARTGVSRKRLRGYGVSGLLVPAAVDSASGYRYYSVLQVREAKVIDALRDAGMPLAEIAALVRDPSRDRVDAWAERVEIETAHRQQALVLARRLLSLETTSPPSAA